MKKGHTIQRLHWTGASWILLGTYATLEETTRLFEHQQDEDVINAMDSSIPYDMLISFSPEGITYMYYTKNQTVLKPMRVPVRRVKLDNLQS